MRAFRSSRVIGISLAAALAIASTQRASAQQGFTDAFPPEEFAARRAKVMASIGDGVAVLQGTTERRGESPLRQSNQFFYLTGVVEPRKCTWLGKCPIHPSRQHQHLSSC